MQNLKLLKEVGVIPVTERALLKACNNTSSSIILRGNFGPFFDAFKELKENDDTALMVAAEAGRVDFISDLLRREGFDPRQTNTEGNTALILAAAAGEDAAVAILLTVRDVGIDHRNAKGFCALSIASMFGHSRIVSALLAARADANRQTLTGLTPLHCAAEFGRSTVVRILHGANAQVDPKDADGVSPLMLAANCDHHQIVRFLILNKADPKAVSVHGWTPLDLAARKGLTGMSTLITQLMGGGERSRSGSPPTRASSSPTNDAGARLTSPPLGNGVSATIVVDDLRRKNQALENNSYRYQSTSPPELPKSSSALQKDLESLREVISSQFTPQGKEAGFAPPNKKKDEDTIRHLQQVDQILRRLEDRYSSASRLAENDINKWRVDAEEAKSQLVSQAQRVISLEEDLMRYKHKTKTLSEAANEHKTVVAQKDAHIAELTRMNNNLQDNLRSQSETLDQVRNQLRRVQEEREREEQLLQTLTQDARDMLLQQREESSRKIIELQEEVMKLSESLQRNEHQLLQEKSSEEVLSARFEKRIGELEEMCDAQSIELNKYRNLAAEAALHQAELRRRLNEVSDSVRALKVVAEKSEEMAQAAHRREENAATIIEGLKVKLQVVEDQRRKVVENCQIRLRKAQDRIEEVVNREKQTQEEAADAVIEIRRDCELKLSELQNKMQQEVSAAWTAAGQQMDQLRKENAEIRKEIDAAVRSELESTAVVGRLESELRQAMENVKRDAKTEIENMQRETRSQVETAKETARKQVETIQRDSAKLVEEIRAQRDERIRVAQDELEEERKKIAQRAGERVQKEYEIKIQEVESNLNRSIERMRVEMEEQKEKHLREVEHLQLQWKQTETDLKAQNAITLMGFQKEVAAIEASTRESVAKAVAEKEVEISSLGNLLRQAQETQQAAEKRIKMLEKELDNMEQALEASQQRCEEIQAKAKADLQEANEKTERQIEELRARGEKLAQRAADAEVALRRQSVGGGSSSRGKDEEEARRRRGDSNNSYSFSSSGEEDNGDEEGERRRGRGRRNDLNNSNNSSNSGSRRVSWRERLEEEKEEEAQREPEKRVESTGWTSVRRPANVNREAPSTSSSDFSFRASSNGTNYGLEPANALMYPSPNTASPLTIPRQAINQTFVPAEKKTNMGNLAWPFPSSFSPSPSAPNQNVTVPERGPPTTTTIPTTTIATSPLLLLPTQETTTAPPPSTTTKASSFKEASEKLRRERELLKKEIAQVRGSSS